MMIHILLTLMGSVKVVFPLYGGIGKVPDVEPEAADRLPDGV